MVRKIYLLITVTLINISLQAQQWVTKKQNATENFYSIKQEFDNYWSNRPREKGKGYMVFKRWEWFAGPRVFPTGNLQYASPSKAKEEFNLYLQNNPTANAKITGNLGTTSTSGNWTAVGPYGNTSNASESIGYAGRVNFIRFDPTSSTTLYAGTPAGGLWKSTNSGTSWTILNNSLSVLGCSDLVIDPNNTNTMYLATGDYDGSDNYSIGILKSTDGGSTWNTTGLSYTASQYVLISRVIIDPNNSSVLFAATNFGIYKSTNSGTTWTNVKNTGMSFSDIEFKPNDSNTLYATSLTSVYKTTTGGGTTASWVDITSSLSGLSSRRMAIAVTPADPNYVYILSADNATAAYGGIYRSINSGSSFSLMSSSPNIFGYEPNGSDTHGQGWYDMALAVSPTNKDELFMGAINTWKSTNGGTSWAIKTHWYDTNYDVMHADCHAIEYQTGSTIYFGTDGGVGVTTNGGSSFSYKNGQMNIAQIYKLGSSATTANLLITGHQDNGTNVLSGSTWTSEYGGDGGFCFIDKNDDDDKIASIQNGGFVKSINGGAWATATVGISGTAAFIAPIIQSPTTSNTYYAGYDQVFKSTNQGGNWTQMGTISAGGATIIKMAASASNTLVLYVITQSSSGTTNIFKTTNGGTSWTSISTGLPLTSAPLTHVAVDNANSSKIYVTLSAYSSGNKVYTSTNGGTSWTNISTGLPNLPVNCVVSDKNGTDAIYVGTDIGVYYKDNSLTAFTPFMTGLPNVVVNDLEIFYPTNRLRAATFGRGVWESDLYSTTTGGSLDASVQSIINPINGSTSCNNSVIPKAIIKNSGITTLTSAKVLYKMDATATQTLNWTGSLATNSTATVTLNTYSGLSAAAHSFSVWTSAPNGGTDVDLSNDKQIASFTITASTAGLAIPFSQTFEGTTFPPTGWSHLNSNVQNASYQWKRTLNSTGIPVTPLSTAVAEFDNQSSPTDITGQLNALRTPALDFSTGTSNLKLEFDIAHQKAFTNQYYDSLMVYVSTNCGVTWTKIYNKGDGPGTAGTLATTTGTAGYAPYVPASNSEWRRETVSLASYAGMTGVYIKFENKSAWGANTYIDNVNVTSTVTSGGTLDASVQSIINPINGSSACNTSVIPKAIIKNSGTATLTSAKILYKMDATATQTLNWTGSLATNGTATVTLNTYSGLSVAAHSFSVWTTAPNGGTDIDLSNDKQIATFTITASTAGLAIPFSEGFENTTFPPTGWIHLNTNVQNAAYQWKRTLNATGIPVTPLSTAIAEFDNQSSVPDITGQLNALRTPALNFSTGTSSLKLEFDVAHQQAFNNGYYDSLKVYISTNCGVTWSKLYNKGDGFGTTGNLATTTGTAGYAQYVPTSNSEWRRETISLASYAGLTGVYIKFENKSAWGANTYIDNINITSAASGGLDASVQSIINPIHGSASCNNSVIPDVIIENIGTTTLTSVKILYKMDATPTQTLNWTGSLATNATEVVTLNTYSGLSAAAHSFSVWTVSPNGGTDIDLSNDKQIATFTITSSTAGLAIPFSEDFENTAFPPTGWGHLNTNVQNPTYQWKRTLHSTGIPVTPLSTAVAEFDNQSSAIDIINQLNALVTPRLDFSTGNSNLQLEFDVSHQQAFDDNYYDSLMVSISTDCGITWTNLYSKGDGNPGNLATTTGTAGYAQYIPASDSDWRRETISLASYAGMTGVQLKFENKSGWGANVYLDNINITSTTSSSGTITANFLSVSPNCTSQTISFNDLSSGNPNAWNWSFPGGIPSTSSLQNPTVTYPTAGTYTVSLTATDGTSPYTPIINTITVNDPQTILVNSETICSGNTATLIASGVNTYTWNTGTISDTEYVTPTSNTTYTVYGEDMNGCLSSAITNVTIGTNAVVSVNSSTVCAGNTAIVSASGASSYLWSNGSTAPSISVNPSSTTTYTVTGSTIGCGSDTKTVTVIVNPLPVITVNSPTICSGGTATLSANGAVTYTWSTGGSSSMITVNPTFNTPYTVGASNINGCTSYVTANVIVAFAPVITINNTTICAGQNAILTANGANTYTWSTGSTANSISVTPNITTIYNVVGNMIGCSGSASQNGTVTVNPLPVVSIAPIAAMCNNVSPVSIITSPVGGTLTGIGVMPGSVFDPSVSGIGTFPVNYYYTNLNGCTNLASLTLTVASCVGIEELNDNVISVAPNPTNDVLTINLFQLLERNTSIELYDALGKLVFEQRNIINNQLQINTTSYAQGIYLLKINSNNWKKSIKIIKE